MTESAARPADGTSIETAVDEVEASGSSSNRSLSALYTGTVRHRRLTPRENAFTYGLYQVLLDLDELEALAGRLRGFSYGRRGLTSFHDRDHFGPVERPVAAKLDRWLADQGRIRRGKALLLTNLRILGYVFNPVSYVFCLDGAGELDFVVAEVNNTFGETYCYLLDDDEPRGGRARSSWREKRFHVSPFMPIEGIGYEWIVTPPGETLTIHIDEYRDDEKFFDATLNLRRRPLTSRTLAAALLRYPHMTLRTITLIHWQALRLWIKGVPVHRKPEPPANGLEKV